MKGLFATLLIIITCTAGIAQIKIIDNKSVKADDFRIDKLGNYYFVKDNNIIKHDKNFIPKAEYSNNLLGEISSIDVSNPFRIMIYYKDFNQIVFLDSELAELKSPVSLDELNLFDAVAVCYSLNGGFWAFRDHSSQIVQFSSQLRQVQQGAQIMRAAKDRKPLKMIETANNVFIRFDSNNIFILDNFGSFVDKIYIEEIIDFTAVENLIVSIDKNFIKLINIHNFKINEKFLNIENIKALDVFGRKFYVLTDQSLITFYLE